MFFTLSDTHYIPKVITQVPVVFYQNVLYSLDKTGV